jgi:hypothetical protein
MTEFYFAADGNWGGSDGLVTVDAEGLEEHFLDYVDSVGEYDRARWAEWFTDNNHDFKNDGYGACEYCDNFDLGTLAEIAKELED